MSGQRRAGPPVSEAQATTFLERERRRLVGLRDELFRDPGLGNFAGKPREFVLEEPAVNLWAGIREDVLDYFGRNRISWWRGEDEGPTGHLLSSQVACVNHLYALRQRRDLATALLAGIDHEVVQAELVDDGFVEFEFIGEKQYLAERSFTRGTHCTSVDAFMIGRTEGGARRAFLIEWKYTERYAPGEDKYIPARSRIYDDLIADPGSPFKGGVNPRALYYEPFYQLMRQALLGWRIAENRDHGCNSFRHVHVAPAQNVEFHRRVTSPLLKGETVSEAWCSVLKDPGAYIGINPEKLMQPLLGMPDAKALTVYLARRYWL